MAYSMPAVLMATTGAKLCGVGGMDDSGGRRTAASWRGSVAAGDAA